MKKSDKKIYLVWVDGINDDSYWSFYETLEEAVIENGNDTEVFVAEIKCIGVFDLNCVLRKKKRKQLSSDVK